ncbi:MAG: hypothetical protein J7578_00825 [Chitinophagaceae bacterium]|nr:hypothetical protein [Chitinophagaceae bacterium]
MSKATQEKAYRVHGMDLISFSIQPKGARDLAKLAVEFNIHQEQKINPDKKLVVIFTRIIILDATRNIELAKLELACGFILHDFENIIKKEKLKGLIIPQELNIFLNRIALATCRGVLFSQLRGYYLQDYILPLLPIE